MSFILFFSFWFGLLLLAHWYVGRRIINAAALRGWKRRFGWLVVFLVFLLPQVPFLFLVNGQQASWLDGVSWIGYVVLGFFSLVLTFIFLRDILVLMFKVAERLERVFGNKAYRSVDPERRQFLIHSTNLGIIVGACMVTGYGLYESRRRATIENVAVPLPRLPDEFDGFRIIQFTDIHVGPTIKREFVEGIVEQIHELNGDLLAFTGDLVDGSVPWLRDDVAPLRELKARHGKLFITGNHEYYSGVQSWVKEAGRLEFDVLINEHRILRRGGSRIVLGGVTDYSGGDFIPEHQSDPDKTFAGAPDDAVRVLLAHQPRSIHAAVQSGIDLQISGHTHGGQFFPWNHLATLNQPYVKGLHKHGEAWVYVSRGTGYWGPPLRLGIPPEITVITLKKS